MYEYKLKGIKLWFYRKFLSKNTEKYTRYTIGFMDGYKKGFKHAVDNTTPVTAIDTTKLWKNINENQKIDPQKVQRKRTATRR